MDSMRRPVGHLPSTVYWRRRVVVLLALALLIALVAWACAGGDDDKKKNTSGQKPAPSGTGSPAPTAITPGTNPTTGAVPPATTGGTNGTPGVPGTGSTPGTSGGTPNQPGGQPGGQTGGQPGAATPGGGGTGPGAGPGGGKAAPNGGVWCNPSMIRVQVQPAEGGKTAYAAGQKVSFRLIVTNQTGPTCYIDFGVKSAYVEVFSGADRYWSSADCSTRPASDLRQLQPGEPQQITSAHDWTWTRSNAGQCASAEGQTPVTPAPVAGTGFYAKGMLSGLEPSGEFRFTVAGK